jgi:hypothetical protein
VLILLLGGVSGGGGSSANVGTSSEGTVGSAEKREMNFKQESASKVCLFFGLSFFEILIGDKNC